MGDKSITRAFEGVGPEIETFLGPEMALAFVQCFYCKRCRVRVK